MERPKCEIGNHQNPRGEHRQQPLTSAMATSYSTHHWRQGKQKQKSTIHQVKKLQHSEGNNQQN